MGVGGSERCFPLTPSVNGFMMDPGWALTVDAKDKEVDEIIFADADFERLGMKQDEIRNISFIIQAIAIELSQDDFSNVEYVLLDKHTVFFNEDLKPFERAPKETALELYRDENFVIVLEEILPNERLGPTALVYLENNTDNYYLFEATEGKVTAGQSVLGFSHRSR